jgi:hypothetical protein
MSPINHPQFGTFCAICFHQLAYDQCAEDTNGQRWDICTGECAQQAGITEKETPCTTSKKNPSADATPP